MLAFALKVALDSSGLTVHNEVQRTVLKLARKQGVKIHQDKLKVEHPVDVLKDVGKTPLANTWLSYPSPGTFFHLQ